MHIFFSSQITLCFSQLRNASAFCNSFYCNCFNFLVALVSVNLKNAFKQSVLLSFLNKTESYDPDDKCSRAYRVKGPVYNIFFVQKNSGDQSDKTGNPCVTYGMRLLGTCESFAT